MEFVVKKFILELHEARFSYEGDLCILLIGTWVPSLKAILNLELNCLVPSRGTYLSFGVHYSHIHVIHNLRSNLVY
jgi:hypothetical protein